MPGVRGHFAPAMTGEQPVDHRSFDRSPKPLRQGGPQRGNDHHGPTAGLLQPGLKKGFLVLQRQQLTASAALGWRGRRVWRLFPPKSGLEVRYGGAAHTQGSGRLFEGRPKLGRQQHGLTLSQRHDRRGGGSGFPSPLDE